MNSKATCTQCGAVNLFGQGASFDFAGTATDRKGNEIRCGVEGCGGALRKWSRRDQTRTAIVTHGNSPGRAAQVLTIPAQRPAPMQPRTVVDVPGQLPLFGGRRA